MDKSIDVRVADSGDMLELYITLPFLIHRDDPDFIPALYRDEVSFHDPDKNKSLKTCDFIRLIAFIDNQPVGRVMGIIHHEWNNLNNDKSVRFYQLDSINDQEVVSTLLGFIETWGEGQKMNRIIGSFGFSDKDPQGIQIEGFEYPPVIASVSNGRYLGKLVEASGFRKFKDCVSYRLEIPDKTPVVYDNIISRVTRNENIRLIEFKRRKQLHRYFKPVMELMNEGYKNIYGFVPLSENDIEKLASQYLSFLDPELVKIIVDKQNKPVAFVIAMPNLSEGLKKSGGYLFPFGFLHLLKAMLCSKQLDLLLGAVSQHYRGSGMNVLLGISLMKSARKKGLKYMDSHLILEENRMMRAEMEKIGGKLTKRYRIYQKAIVPAQQNNMDVL
jgi:hypothetical protein